MNPNLKMLIDGIVGQTTVLLAQLSTASGLRAPLAHVADQVFLERAREIEAQGVRRQVVTDMFGLALRSYQKKMNRLTESASVRDRTLWEAVLEYIDARSSDHGDGSQPSRAEVMARFERDGERQVASVLADLVRSGLIYATGSGKHAVYGTTSEAVRSSVRAADAVEGVAIVAWLRVFHGEASSIAELIDSLPHDAALVRDAVDQLLQSGRLRQGDDGQLTSSNVLLRLGADAGWEAAVLDHFRAVAVAIATKVRGGERGAREADATGGSTFTFSVSPGHPHRAAVYDLLRSSRLTAQALSDRVASYNEDHPLDPAETSRVTYYVGQVVEDGEEG